MACSDQVWEKVQPKTHQTQAFMRAFDEAGAKATIVNQNENVRSMLRVEVAERMI